MENKDTPENIGKHFLYNHQTFCSKHCIEEAKRKPHTLIRNVKPTDWNEQGSNNPECANSIEDWKTIRERKEK